VSHDEQNLDLLAIFHYVVGGLTALLSCIFLAYVAIGIAMLCGALDGKAASPTFLAWVFLIVGSGFTMCGWAVSALIIIAGVKLKKRRSRTFCLVVAGIECVVMPFGTVLGVFTITILMRDHVKLLFNASPGVAHAQASIPSS
jgi:hypothetical protein